MAVFVGTSSTDLFLGTAGVADTFQFTVANLSAADNAAGGNGAGIDKLTLLDGGAVNFVTVGGGLSGLERIDLSNLGNVVTLAESLAFAGGLAVNGGNGNDTIDAAGFSSLIRVNAFLGGGTDTAKGGDGNDTFRVAPAELTAADTIDGRGGIDTITFTQAASIGSGAIFAGVTRVEGIQLETSAAANNLLTLSDSLVAKAEGKAVTVTGGAGNDTVNAAAVLAATGAVTFVTGGGTDTYLGGTGVDIVKVTSAGLGGTDILNGGAGAGDVLDLTTAGTYNTAQFAGVSGFETVRLSASGITLNIGSDFPTVGDGHFVIIQGSSGNDTVSSTLGNFDLDDDLAIYLGGGNDTVTTGPVGVNVYVAPGDLTAGDHITHTGQTDFDALTAIHLLGAGTVTTAQIANLVNVSLHFSDDGNKLILDNTTPTNGIIADTIIGGEGDDKVDGHLLDATRVIRVNFGGGDDNAYGGAGADSLSGDEGNDVLRGGGGIDSLNGGGGEDVLYGGAGNDFLAGGLGDDISYGGAGDDNFQDFEGGADIMVGGANNDTYSVDNAGDVVAELSGGGTDTVQSILTYTLGDNVENLTLLSTVNLNGTGNAASNKLVGNSGNNVLSGLGGNDTLEGGGGNDTLNSSTGADSFVFGPGSGQDSADYDDVSDVINVAAYGYHSFAEMQAGGGSITSLNAGADSRVTFSAGNFVDLIGSAFGTVVGNSSDFIYA